MSVRKLILFDLALLSLLILASRLALILHEFAGHGLVALFFGAQGLRAELSLFGGGWIHYDFPEAHRLSPFGHSLISAGGILVNLLSGLAASLLARRAPPTSHRRLFLHFLGAGSIGQALFYLSNGFYFGTGDPQGMIEPFAPVGDFQIAWIFFVPFFSLTAWFAARGWIEFLGSHADVRTPLRRFGWTLATIGVATLSYFGLWGMTWTSGTDHTLEELRIEQEVERETVRRIEAVPPQGRPETTPPMPVVTREEVADRVPLPIAPYVLFATGLITAALSILRRNPQTSPGEWKEWISLILAGSATATILLIAIFFR